ncbi:MAG: hypothetical protein H5T86_15250, partial [Armatimonadetes bacterium]|nr:hypothetical protein [Armatimonadota bacterium]
PRVGVAAAIFYLLNGAMLDYAAGGLEAPMIAFELLLLVAAVVSFFADSPKRAWKAATVGALAGVLYLTKYTWGLAIVPCVVGAYLASPTRHRAKMAVLCLAAFIAVISPWLVRNTIVAGSPFFSFRWLESVMYTRTYSGNTLYRTFTRDYPHWLLFALTSPREVIAKARTGLMTIYGDPVTAPGPYVGALFIAGILATLGKRAFELGRLVFYATYILVVIALLILFPAPRLTAPICSVATLFGVAFFVKLAEDMTRGLPERKRNGAVIGGLVVLGIIHSLPVLQQLSAGRPAAAVRTETVKMAARQVASLIDSPIVTDVPWPIAWFGEKPAIWLPVSFDDLDKIEDAIGPVKWMLLTPFTRRTVETERTGGWARIWEAAMRQDIVEHGFAVYKRLPGDWILFRRTTLAGAGQGG